MTQNTRPCTRRDSWATLVDEALSASSLSAVSKSAGRWSLTFDNNFVCNGTARMEAGFLLVTARISNGIVQFKGGRVSSEYKDLVGNPAGLWKVLGWNGLLPGGVKFAFSGRPFDLVAHAELPLIDESDLADRVEEVVEGIQLVDAFLTTGQYAGDSRYEQEDSPAKPTAEKGASLADLCRESGWEVYERKSGWRVTLDVPQSLCRAALHEGNGKEPRAEVRLPMAEDLSETCRHALGLLLLRACGVFRFVRFVVEGEPSAPKARMESILHRSCGQAELNHSLSALSVCCRYLYKEVQAFEDELIANRYLATCMHEMWAGLW